MKKKIRIAALASVLSVALIGGTLVVPVFAADDNSKEDIEIGGWDIPPADINLHFNKIITGEHGALNLNEDESYNFYITLEHKETGNIIKGILNSKDGLTIKNALGGTYIIKELDDMWFTTFNVSLTESIDGIEIKEESGNYVFIEDETVNDGTTANIDIINKTDEERFYNNKYDVKNLFFGF